VKRLERNFLRHLADQLKKISAKAQQSALAKLKHVYILSDQNLIQRSLNWSFLQKLLFLRPIIESLSLGWEWKKEERHQNKYIKSFYQKIKFQIFFFIVSASTFTLHNNLISPSPNFFQIPHLNIPDDMMNPTLLQQSDSSENDHPIQNLDGGSEIDGELNSFHSSTLSKNEFNKIPPFLSVFVR
jgi:hypothetical protein